MSRAFHPPDTLEKEDIRTIADVRRNVWKGGFQGLLYGSVTGLSLHTVARYGLSKLYKKPRLQLTRNTSFLSFLLGGALGSFVMATTKGKNEVHNLHDIFQIGKKEKSSDRMDLDDLKQRRLTRRRTLAKRMENQGLSDSHGGQWSVTKEDRK